VGRNLFNASIYGTTELVSYAWMPGIATLALGYAQFHNEHIRVTLLIENVSPRAERVLEIFAELVAVALALWIVQLCWFEVADSRALGETATGLTWLPKWPGRFCLVLAYAGIAAAAIARLYRLWRGTDST
jgi:TRAP-type C4-dicarboxylate transport system permease small subunit